METNIVNNIVAKKKFVFENGVAMILFFKRHSNIFLVLLDSTKRHIVTLTSGFCQLGKNKKQKIAPLNMSLIIKKLKTYITLYNIKTISLLMKQRISSFFKKLRQMFKYYDITISSFFFILKKAHGFKRGRTPRRV